MERRHRTVIDACCIINLLASRRAGELLSALGWSLVTPDLTRREVLYLEEPPGPDGVRVRVKVDTSELEQSGQMEVLPISGEVLDAYVVCAEYLTDSDAATVALAGTLSLPLMSDDPKVRRVSRERFAGVPVWSTLAFLKAATDRLRLNQADLQRIAFDVRWRGRFLPPNGDPDREWFRGLLLQPGAEEPGGVSSQ